MRVFAALLYAAVLIVIGDRSLQLAARVCFLFAQLRRLAGGRLVVGLPHANGQAFRVFPLLGELPAGKELAPRAMRLALPHFALLADRFGIGMELGEWPLLHAVLVMFEAGDVPTAAPEGPVALSQPVLQRTL